MTRHARLFLVLSALFALMATPVAAQEEADIDAVPQALPTAMPFSEGPIVQAVLYFSPTCPHCHTVITESLPPLFAEHGGTPVTTYDESLSADDVAFYLMSNGQLQILFVDASVPDGQAMFQADSIRLDLDRAGVPRLDILDTYLVGSDDIPDQFPDLITDGLAGDGVSWPEVPGLARALEPFIASGAVPELPAESAETPEA